MARFALVGGVQIALPSVSIQVGGGGFDLPSAPPPAPPIVNVQEPNGPLVALPIRTDLLPPDVPPQNALYTIGADSNGQPGLIPVFSDHPPVGQVVYTPDGNGGFAPFARTGSLAPIGVSNSGVMMADPNGQLDPSALLQPAAPGENFQTFCQQNQGQMPYSLPAGVDPQNALYVMDGRRFRPLCAGDPAPAGHVFCLDANGIATPFGSLNVDVQINNGVFVTGCAGRDGCVEVGQHQAGQGFKNFHDSHAADVHQYVAGHAQEVAVAHNPHSKPIVRTQPANEAEPHKLEAPTGFKVEATHSSQVKEEATKPQAKEEMPRQVKEAVQKPQPKAEAPHLQAPAQIKTEAPHLVAAKAAAVNIQKSVKYTPEEHSTNTPAATPQSKKPEVAQHGH